MYVANQFDKHYIAVSKAKCSVFIYSLFVQIMYITVNKVMFIVIEIINPMIRNCKRFTINTTSLSQRFTLLCTVANNICLLSLFPIFNTIQYFFIKNKRTLKKIVFFSSDLSFNLKYCIIYIVLGDVFGFDNIPEVLIASSGSLTWPL